MYNLLNGQAPQDKIVYGLDPSIGPQGSLPIPAILTTSLQSQGILFPEVHRRRNRSLLRFGHALQGVEMLLKGSATDRKILPSSNMPESMPI